MKQRKEKLDEWKLFLGEAKYGDVIIRTSAHDNHEYNDIDFMLAVNCSAELTFYRFSTGNGNEYMKPEETDLFVTAMKNGSPGGYYLNYYQDIYSLYPSFTDYIKNRVGEWVEIGLIDQLLQKYSILSNAETVIILQMVGFPPNDYETKLYFNPADAERKRMAQRLFAQYQNNEQVYYM